MGPAQGRDDYSFIIEISFVYAEKATNLIPVAVSDSNVEQIIYCYC